MFVSEFYILTRIHAIIIRSHGPIPESDGQLQMFLSFSDTIDCYLP